LFTQYSSSARARVTSTGQTTQQITPYFVTGPDGSQTPIYTAVPVTTTSSFTYFDQLSNNLNQSLSLNLRVPIFQGYLSRNRITTARIQQQNAELNGQNIRLQLRQQIETAYTSMRAGANRYRATQAQVAALERAFQVAESRFNAGASNATDYAIAKTNLDRSRAGLVQAKYDYVFRLKILDFYQNKPLTF
jgi:outer membrane protein